MSDTVELTTAHLGRRVTWTGRYGGPRTGLLRAVPDGGNGTAQVFAVDGFWYVPVHELALETDDDRHYTSDTFLADAHLAELEASVELACQGIYSDHDGYWPSECERARIASALVAVAVAVAEPARRRRPTRTPI